MKKSNKLIAFFCIIAISVAILSGCGNGDSTVASWTTSGHMQNLIDDESWTLSIGQANGHIRRDVTFTQESLDFFFLRASIGSGEARLTVTQGNNTAEVNLAVGVDGFIWLPDIGPGNIRLRLDFDDAADIDITMTWDVRGLF